VKECGAEAVQSAVHIRGSGVITTVIS